jgi:single-strand DNA-binding protein
MSNICIFCGRATKDAEVTYTQGDKPICIAKFGLAVDRRGRERGADFPNMVAFGKTGEFCEKYVKKGTKVVIRSHYQSGSYTNHDGVKVYTHDFIVDDIEFAESKAATSQNTEQTTQQTSTQQTTQPNAQTGAGIDNYMNIPDGIDSDDMPFA